MKYLVILILIMIIGTDLKAQTEFVSIYALHRSKEIFRFSESMKNIYLESWQSLYLNAILHHRFNEIQESDLCIDKLLEEHINEIDDSLKLELYETQLHNRVYNHNYKEAERITGIILEGFTGLMDSTEAWETVNANAIWKSARDLPAQTVDFLGDSKIEITRDMAGLQNISVSINGNNEKFIFDTGANFSVVSESCAKKLGLIFLQGSFKVGAVTGSKVDSKLAYAPELSIAEMKFRNVLFLVLPDESLSFAGGLYVINGIIGFPVIKQMAELHFRDEMLFIPQNRGVRNFRNLAFEGFLPVIKVIHRNDSLAFTFDTGARTTLLYKPFLEKYRQDIESKYTLSKIDVGGAGGIKKVKGYNLKDINLNVAGSEANLKEVSLISETMLKNSEYFYGNLGQDFMKQFSEMIINFESMFVEFK